MIHEELKPNGGSAQASANIDDLDLANELVEVDANVSPEEFFTPSLPDDGDHPAILRMGDRGITSSRQKDKAGNRTGQRYIMVHIQAQLLDEDGKVAGSVFDNPTSIVMQRGTSRLHAMLDVAGVPAPARCTQGELEAHVVAALAQSPRCTVVTQWEAQEKIGDEYVTLRKAQKNFPPVLIDGRPSGKFSPEVDGKTGPVRAQARVVRYARASKHTTPQN